VDRRFVVVSRSDSTLRGHFPAKLRRSQRPRQDFDAWLLMPFFQEGGRYTIDDVHYRGIRGVASCRPQKN